MKDTGTKEENILQINKEDNNANLQFIDVADVKKNEEFDLFIPVLKQGVKTVSYTIEAKIRFLESTNHDR